MKCAVIVMATLMIIASMLLVGVSLAMAEHIDELGTYIQLAVYTVGHKNTPTFCVMTSTILDRRQ